MIWISAALGTNHQQGKLSVGLDQCKIIQSRPTSKGNTSYIIHDPEHDSEVILRVNAYDDSAIG